MVCIAISQSQYEEVWNHLLPVGNQREFAAFMFADYEEQRPSPYLVVRETRLITGKDFGRQESDFFELSDDARIGVIKIVHQSGRALIELHSHPSPEQWAAAFSLADMNGFRETVPNMLWRLPGRPYTAIVAAPSGFDALTWREPNKPTNIDRLIVDKEILLPTNYTLGGKYERYGSR